MTVTITYLARDGYDLTDSHADGVQYEIVTAYSSVKPQPPKIVRKDIKALTGRLVSLLHREERYYTFHYNKVPLADLAIWREFADSVKYGSGSPFEMDCSTVPHIAKVLENLVMIDPPRFPQESTTQWFEINFKCYMQPGY